MPIDPYGTHFPVLAAAVARTKGPILELGAGHYSTPLLHLLAAGEKRPILTVETKVGWLAGFRDLETAWHRFVHVSEGRFDALDLSGPWGVAFVDHDPEPLRARSVLLLKDRAEFVVVHDTQAEVYGYEAAFAQFRFRYDFRRYLPWTTVVSMTRPFDA